MNSYFECGACHHQWSTTSFDTAPCPVCKATKVQRAIMGGPRPTWFNPSQVGQVTGKEKLAILIGGPADGRRVVLRPGMRHLNVAHRLALVGSAHPEVNTCVAATADFTQYELFWAAGNVHVMCPSHMDREQAMRTLLDGYRCEVVR